MSCARSYPVRSTPKRSRPSTTCGSRPSACGTCSRRPSSASGRAGETARRRARDLQDVLGEMHDCDVLLPRVHDHAAELRLQDSSSIRGRAGDAPDLDPRLVGLARHRTAYRGLESLAVYIQARRGLLFDRFGEMWAREEEKGTWDRLERAAARPPRGCPRAQTRRPPGRACASGAGRGRARRARGARARPPRLGRAGGRAQDGDANVPGRGLAHRAQIQRRVTALTPRHSAQAPRPRSERVATRRRAHAGARETRGTRLGRALRERAGGAGRWLRPGARARRGADGGGGPGLHTEGAQPPALRRAA